MSIISIQNLTFGYDNALDNVFEDVSLTMDTDWRLGIIGRNGRGKTTLLRLLLGQLEYRGSISYSGAFEYYPFTVSDENLPIWQVAAGICPEIELWELEKELSLLKMTVDIYERSYSTLSHGERSKVQLASLFLRENAFLLIDEPTNHLDMTGRDAVAEYLSGKSGFLLVSHDRRFLDNCVDHILSINRNGISVQKGDFTAWDENRKSREAYELAENRRLKKDIKRLAESAQRAAAWSEKVEKAKYTSGNKGESIPDRGFVGAAAARSMKRAKAIESRKLKSMDEKSDLLKDVETTDTVFFHGLSFHSKRLITAKNLELFINNTPICTIPDLQLEGGEKIAILGGNGAGKTTALRFLAGEAADIQTRGEYYKAKGLCISYVRQDASGLKGSIADYAEAADIDPTLFMTLLRKLDFSRQQFLKNIEDFSAGQKKKILIAASLSKKAHIYIWDEPLNYIDVFSRIQLEDLIKESSATIVFVEHDRTFMENTGAKTLEIIPAKAAAEPAAETAAEQPHS